MNQVPTDKEGFEAFRKKNLEQSKALNEWLESFAVLPKQLDAAALDVRVPGLAETLAIDEARRGKRYGFGGTTDTEPGKLADDLDLNTSARGELDRSVATSIVEAAAALEAIAKRAGEDTRRRQFFERETAPRSPVGVPKSVQDLQQSVSALFALENAQRAKLAGMGGTTDTEPGKTKDDLDIGRPRVVTIDAGSIAAMIQPAGVQDVREVNRQPPVVTVNQSVTITGVVDPKAAANAAMSQAGSKVKEAVEAAYSD